MAFLGDDGWDYPRPARRPSPHHMPSGEVYPNGMLGVGGSGIRRSRSHGHSPMPNINIYNRMDQEGSPYPQPYQPQYVPYPVAPTSRKASPRASPEHRGRSRLGDRLADGLESEFMDMALEHRYGRSHSRGRSGSHSSGRAEWELARRKEELREISRERNWRLEQERLENKFKLEQLEADRRREREEEERKRYVEEYERKQRLAEDKRKEDQKRAVDDWERRQREEKDKQKAEEQRIKERMDREAREAKEKAKLEEQRWKEKMDREAREKKEEEERIIREVKERERKAKEKEEREYNEFLRKQKEKEEKKKKEEKEHEEKLQAEMRERLLALGYTQQTVEIMVDKEKAKKFKHDVETRREDRIDVFRGPKAPVYPKVHRDYLAVETLKYYDLPWEYDRSNPDYIIILRDMDKRETDVLFEHTTRLRTGKLLLEPKKKEPKLAMYRRRSRSRTGAPMIEKGILRLS